MSIFKWPLKTGFTVPPRKISFAGGGGGGGGGLIIGVGPTRYPLFLTTTARVFHLHVSVEALCVNTTKFTCDTN